MPRHIQDGESYADFMRTALCFHYVGVIGWSVIRAVARAKTMKNLRKLFGDEWLEKEVLCEEPKHLLGKWHKKDPDNPVTALS